ncbi:MAG: Na-translocating system protein MpsB [Legionellaceae bacterium]|nr:Na-translocating system protein MpsB [Legionellaceae bacterium]
MPYDTAAHISDNFNALLHGALCYAQKHVPAQGPLEFFVHHNPLHHYQHLDFFTAVKKAAHDYQCNTFMPEEFYWNEYAYHNMHKPVLLEEINRHIKKYQLNLPNHIIYHLLIQKETSNNCLNEPSVKRLRQQFTTSKIYFYQGAMSDEFNVDLDYLMAPIIFKFCSAYFDAGSASWAMPHRKRGLWYNFKAFYQQSSLLDSRFLKTLSQLLAQISSYSAEQTLMYLLKELNIPPLYLNDYLFELAYRYKGWSGFQKSVVAHPEWIKNPSIKPDFLQYMTILVLCEMAAIRSITQKLPSIPRQKVIYLHSERFMNHFFYELQKHPELKNDLLGALPHLDDNARCYLLHRAFEQTFYQDFLSTYSTQTRIKQNNRPEYQIICCLDEREESFRRYLEADPSCETFGYPGHFGLNIQFKGYFDKHLRALCPVSAKPEYTVTEVARVQRHIGLRLLFFWGELQWLAALSSKTLLSGTIESFIGFFLKIIPFTLDLISPRITSQLKQWARQSINNLVQTQLHYSQEQRDVTPSEFISSAKNLLRHIGLSSQFSDYVIILGHGSSSLNNPHEAAYDCGACGGGRGGPNARMMAQILNDPTVRKILKTHDIVIPNTTHFIGAYHNTGSDDLTFYDQSTEQQLVFATIKTRMQKAAQWNAQERCRRFSAIMPNQSLSYYQRKARERTIDLRQPRPEYGHSSNALCIIGPRHYSRTLFLDRRAFLISYESKQDPEADILEAILTSAAPVCAGINLEYFFSFINNESYGCGTKLPHNVTGLIAVMNGYLSDLQNGLSSQMIEIHQPIRLCLLIICTLKQVQKILSQHNEFAELCKNQWIILTIHNLDDDKIYCYQDESFVHFCAAASSPTYFRIDNDIFNYHNHLHFGHITS